MREDTTFSNRKLTTEEFSKKYWLDGKFPYQYHTGTIEDGRDEREQFIFNNMRALYELDKSYELVNSTRCSRIEERLEQFESDLRSVVKWQKDFMDFAKKTAALAVTSTAVSLIAIAVFLRNKI